jgi:hypothetical protein
VPVVDAPVGDAAPDATGDGAGDTTIDTTPDATSAVCPTGLPPLEVCGCGCCGGVAESWRCYYPARGETREAIPNPMPSPTECALVGCTEGSRYVCCADPGPAVEPTRVCAADTSIEDLSRFAVTRRDGDVCTTVEVGGTVPMLPITGPPGRPNTNAWRAPCDGSAPRAYAIGGLGAVTPGTAGASARYDVHVVLFFYRQPPTGVGAVEAVRIDAADVAIALPCGGDACTTCGACQLDATYRFTTNGGLGAYRDATVLSPPASYLYQRKPEGLPVPERSCAPAFPACGSAALDVGDVMAALADPDVKQAFAQSLGVAPLPFYGVDYRGGDGAADQITRDGGGGFLIGGPCPSAPTAPCTPIPAGLSRLVSTLRALDQQQLADPTCDFTRP